MTLENIQKKLTNEIEIISGKKISGIEVELFKGSLDSLNIVHLILFIENEFSIIIKPYEVSMDTFGTIQRASSYIYSKLHQ